MIEHPKTRMLYLVKLPSLGVPNDGYNLGHSRLTLTVCGTFTHFVNKFDISMLKQDKVNLLFYSELRFCL